MEIRIMSFSVPRLGLAIFSYHYESECVCFHSLSERLFLLLAEPVAALLYCDAECDGYVAYCVALSYHCEYGVVAVSSDLQCAGWRYAVTGVEHVACVVEFCRAVVDSECFGDVLEGLSCVSHYYYLLSLMLCYGLTFPFDSVVSCGCSHL